LFLFCVTSSHLFVCSIEGAVPQYCKEGKEKSCCQRYQQQTKKYVQRLERQMDRDGDLWMLQNVDLDEVRKRLVNVEREWNVLDDKSTDTFLEQRILREQIQRLHTIIIPVIIVLVFLVLILLALLFF
jgi:hypothetical protein